VLSTNPFAQASNHQTFWITSSNNLAPFYSWKIKAFQDTLVGLIFLHAAFKLKKFVDGIFDCPY
jgi:hypothetical protein